MPIFNEEGSLWTVLEEWSSELDSSGIDYGLLLMDDGSADRTPDLLQEWLKVHASGRIEVITRANRGHGQTCLEGYRLACSQGVPWVFQIDSDGQCDPSFFPYVWEQRRGHEAVYGHRARRCDGWKRVLASSLVRKVVKMSTGADCTDANVPYRLIATAKLMPLVETIPSDFDLANIALAVQIKRAGWHEAFVPIVFRPRAGGEPSVPLSRFAHKAIELFSQLRRLPDPVSHG